MFFYGIMVSQNFNMVLCVSQLPGPQAVSNVLLDTGPEPGCGENVMKPPLKGNRIDIAACL